MGTWPHKLTREEGLRGSHNAAQRRNTDATHPPKLQHVVNRALSTLDRAMREPHAKINANQLRAAQIVMSTLVSRVQLDQKGDAKGDRLLRAIEKLETGAVPPVENGPAIAPPARPGPLEEAAQPIDSKGDSSSPGTEAEE